MAARAQTRNPGRVVIVGGGIVGLVTALELAQEGVAATVIERDSLASHASGFAFGLLNPLSGAGIPGPLLEPALQSMGLHLRLQDLLQRLTRVDTEYRHAPNLRLVFSEAEAERLRAQMVWQQERGYVVRWLDAAEVRELEPRVAPSVVGGVLAVGTAEVDPYRLCLAVAQAAEAGGATVRHGLVTGLARRGDRVTGVRLGPTVVPADTVVLAMGPWTQQAGEWLGLPIPVRPLKGQILRLRSGQAPLRVYASWGGNYAHTKADGLVWTGTTEEEAGFSEQPTVEARDAVLAQAAAVFPYLEDAELVQHTACLRPVTPDALPILGFAPGHDNVLIVTGGGRKGILLGPLMGRATADLLLRGETALPVGHLGPERFLSRSAGAPGA